MLFSNITTSVEDVAKISADWIIAESNGNAGVVVFTDDSIPFAMNKSELIKNELATYSVAINDLSFADAAPALRAAGKQGNAAPFNIGSGDGDPSAFQHINSGQFQAATDPEPLSEQGWQIVDEFNRAFSGNSATGYAAPVHITTAENSSGALGRRGVRECEAEVVGRARAGHQGRPRP